MSDVKKKGMTLTRNLCEDFSFVLFCFVKRFGDRSSELGRFIHLVSISDRSGRLEEDSETPVSGWSLDLY